jgi:hypothetical protein
MCPPKVDNFNGLTCTILAESRMCVCNRKREKERESACVSVRVCESVYMRVCLLVLRVYMKVHNDSEQNAIQHKNTQHYDTWHSNTQQNDFWYRNIQHYTKQNHTNYYNKKEITVMPFTQCQWAHCFAPYTPSVTRFIT